MRITRSGCAVQPTIPDLNGTPPNNLVAFVRLIGRESADPGGRPLTYRWTVASAPKGSSISSVSNADRPFSTFVPDLEGKYVIRLVVNNGL